MVTMATIATTRAIRAIRAFRAIRATMATRVHTGQPGPAGSPRPAGSFGHQGHWSIRVIRAIRERQDLEPSWHLNHLGPFCLHTEQLRTIKPILWEGRDLFQYYTAFWAMLEIVFILLYYYTVMIVVMIRSGRIANRRIPLLWRLPTIQPSLN